MKNIQKLGLFVGASFATTAFGDDYSLGQIADNISGPLLLIRKIFEAGSVGVGIFYICLAFMRYLKHRKNAQESPLSTVIVYFLIGLALVCIPLAHEASLYFAAQQGISNVVN